MSDPLKEVTSTNTVIQMKPVELWLFRTRTNRVSGPFTREEAQRRVMEGELHAQDEICRTGSYWIFLHETEEVRKALGVLAPRVDADRENTQTDAGATQTDTETKTLQTEGKTFSLEDAAKLKIPPTTMGVPAERVGAQNAVGGSTSISSPRVAGSSEPSLSKFRALGAVILFLGLAGLVYFLRVIRVLN